MSAEFRPIQERLFKDPVDQQEYVDTHYGIIDYPTETQLDDRNILIHDGTPPIDMTDPNIVYARTSMDLFNAIYGIPTIGDNPSKEKLLRRIIRDIATSQTWWIDARKGAKDYGLQEEL